nr:hypothetical protein [Tanacetum cinerariifolium]
MSADSAVTYTSVHSVTRFWRFPSEDPYEEADQQLLEQAPRSPGSRRAEIPEADTPPWKRLLLTAPKHGCEVGESYAAAATRQPGPIMARSVDCSFVDTMETRESSEFYSRHHDAQKDRAVMRAEIELLRRERLAYKQEKASRVRNGYNSNGSGPRLAQAVRECTYPDFLKCQPLNFKGTKGVVGLTQWSRSYMVELPCEDCYSGSCSGIAMENFEENDDRQELALMCDRMFPEESDRVEKYIGGLPDTIHDSVKATRPKTM